jgi:hypothetical protein
VKDSDRYVKIVEWSEEDQCFPMIRLTVISTPLALPVILFALGNQRGAFRFASIFQWAIGPIFAFILYSMLHRSFQRLGQLLKSN